MATVDPSASQELRDELAAFHSALLREAALALRKAHAARPTGGRGDDVKEPARDEPKDELSTVVQDVLRSGVSRRPGSAPTSIGIDRADVGGGVGGVGGVDDELERMLSSGGYSSERLLEEAIKVFTSPEW